MNAPVETPAVASPPRKAPVEKIAFRIGRESTPDLFGHEFLGLAVVPGSFYFELARRAVGGAERPAVVTFSKVEFREPLFLSDKELDVAVGVARLNDRSARCSFFAASAQSAGDQLGTTLEVDGDSAGEIDPPPAAIAPEIFRQNAAQQIEGEAFYRRLRENGNQYGPRFQGLRRLWRSGNEVVARLALARTDPAEQFFIDPIAVDAAIQSLMMFGLDEGRTLVLRSIEQVVFRRPVAFADGWVSTHLRAERRPGLGGLIGDVEVRDDAGACWLELRGVRLTAHGSSGGAQAAPGAATNIVVAATFTADPLADVFHFWSEMLALPTRLDFAPYGQVFQQLLDPASQFHRNRDGCNVILVSLADWLGERWPALPSLDRARAAACFGGLDRCTLPNGLEVGHLNRHETEYVFREIFQDRCYLRHGVRLPETGTVIDIGANIGLFSLFVRCAAPGVTVLAYEPSPAAFQALKANCEAYGPGLHPFNAGVAERRGHASLTCYEKSSVFSTFHADRPEDARAIRTVATNVAREHARGSGTPDEGLMEELLSDRLNFRTVTCPVVSVSDIIRENHVSRVDLLKIDAEKCEREILRGIEEQHWPMIEQVVVEVHDRTRAVLGEVQDLLRQRGFHCAVVEEELLAGSGLFNVYATRDGSHASGRAAKNDAAGTARELQRTADEFADALDTFARRTTSPTLLAFVPCQSGADGDDLTQTLARVEGGMLRRVRELPRVHALGSDEILARYPSADFHQRDARQLGHVPYMADGFAAIGTCLFRSFAAMHRRPFKVIALDCDHTLWQGVCGEDGPLGVVVTPAHRTVQEFMIRQNEAGTILCLCSKNQEADVWSVFAQNPGMALRREHLTASRINWSPKSGNLRSLAAELNVGLDSLIFIDDNPVERAEVRANCAEVFALPLPVDSDLIPHFLDHVWAFDHFKLTAEDRARSRMLDETRRREDYRKQAPTLQSFIAGLELEVVVLSPEASLIGRLAQLTQRTNQFNFSTIRRTEGELLRFLGDHNHRGFAVQVKDRFGDYGVVGLVLYAPGDDGERVDTFLLSCRVLGRGVEHRMLAELGRRALAAGKSWVEFILRPTEKNQPARDFVASLAPAFPGVVSGESTRRFAAKRLAELRYEDMETRPDRSEAAPDAAPTAAGQPPDSSPGEGARFFERFETIARELDQADKIAMAVEAQRLRAAGFTATDTDGSAATLDEKLLRIWRRILRNPHLGPDDKFMEAGGTSLAAVQIVAVVRKELQLPLSVAAFFESPTVRRLSGKLAPTGAPDGATKAAMARGARRAQRMRRSP